MLSLLSELELHERDDTNEFVVGGAFAGVGVARMGTAGYDSRRGAGGSGFFVRVVEAGFGNGGERGGLRGPEAGGGGAPEAVD